jgi:hypothetical protein
MKSGVPGDYHERDAGERGKNNYGVFGRAEILLERIFLEKTYLLYLSVKIYFIFWYDRKKT